MRLLKYIGKHHTALLLIIVLLIAEVFCDLMLPNYTSQIVDVGIQQAGIEHVAADELSHHTYDAIAQTDAVDFDKQLFQDSYEYDSRTDTYRLTPYGLTHIDELDILLAGPLAQVHGLGASSSADTANATDADASSAVQAATDAANATDAAASTAAAPATDSTAAALQDEKGIARQTGIAAARAEYEQLGYDLDARQLNYLLLTGLKMMGFVVMSAALFILIGFIASRTSASIGRELRERLFMKVIAFGEVEMQRFSPASLITRGTNDVQQIQMMSNMFMRMVMYAPIMAIGGIIMVSQMNLSMSWIIGLAVAVIFVVAGALMAITLPKFRIIQKLIDRVNLISREMITGVSVVRAFGQQSREQQRFDVANTKLMRTQLFTNRAMSLLMPVITMVMNLVSVAIVWVGAGEIDQGVIQTGDLIAFITYSMLIIMSFLILSMLVIILPRADVSAQRIDEVLAADILISDPACPVEIEEGQLVGEGASIEFDHVTFAYADDCEPVLHDITFKVAPGQTCAFIGSTGSGKSTIIKLLERFHDVTEGSVRVDGIDVRDMRLQDLRSLFGYVPQRSFLFSGTIESNVGFGEDELDDKRILVAIDIAQATPLLNQKSDGLLAEITQGGTNVSGGQRQRLAIARALATDARAFLFDDCFSALDYKTDAALRHALNERLPGRTKVIVAQRIATVMNADIIIVLDDGHIVGQGTHQELMASCELYREIAYSQLSAAELQGGELR